MTTPEESQRVLDLRVRMLENIRAGRPSHHGITLDELKLGLAHVTSPRTNAATAATKTKKAAKPAGKPIDSANMSEKTKAMLALLEGDV